MPKKKAAKKKSYSGQAIKKAAANAATNKYNKRGRVNWPFDETDSPQTKKDIEKAKIAYGKKGSGTKVKTKKIISGSGHRGSLLTMEVGRPDRVKKKTSKKKAKKRGK